METTNPYQPPIGKLHDAEGDFGTIKILSAQGRLGRLRYIAYSIGLTLLIYFIMALFFAIVGQLPEPANNVARLTGFVLGCSAMLVISFLLTIQRCHDFNVTGWLSLILLIPLLPLIYWFIPGTKGRNDFGPPPPPNRGSGIVVVLLLITVVLIIGILAAIAIPAYQDYVQRAQQIQMQSE